MIDRADRFLVVGAGPVGLGIARALKARGIPFDQIDADDDLGGNWKHGVYTTAHIISSKKTTEYADYPMPAHYPDFPSGAQMLAYLRGYARHFELDGSIEFKTQLVAARPRDDQRWEIELSGGEARLYQGLLVCTGHHWDRRWPDVPGKFEGELIHSKDYRAPEQLAGKRVLIIGAGNSACDVASEAARVGTSCDLSMRRGHWFLPKTIFGMPVVDIIPSWMPVPVQRVIIRGLLKITVGDYARYGLPHPKQRIFEEHPTLNSELLHYLKHGRIQVRPDVTRFEGREVHFSDGSHAEFDLVVAATGFHVSFPFLPQGLVPVEGPVAKLYGGVALAEVKNLYIVGSSQPRFGFGPLVTPGAELLATLIELQKKMELPIGRVLQEMGVKLPETHLIDPHKAMREMKRAKWLLPKLAPRIEKRLRKKLGNSDRAR